MASSGSVFGRRQHLSALSEKWFTPSRTSKAKLARSPFTRPWRRNTATSLQPLHRKVLLYLRSTLQVRWHTPAATRISTCSSRSLRLGRVTQLGWSMSDRAAAHRVGPIPKGHKSLWRIFMGQKRASFGPNLGQKQKWPTKVSHYCRGIPRIYWLRRLDLN